MDDCVDCYAVRGETIVDVLHPITGLTVCYGKTLEQVRVEYPSAEKMTVDEFCASKAERQHTPIVWSETTEEKYWEMLEVLPPAAMSNGGFLVGEPFDHDASNGQPRYEGFKQSGDKYFVGSRPMTRKEFKQELQAV